MEENILRGLVIAGLLIFVIVQILRLVFKKYSLALTRQQKYSLKDLFKLIVNNSDLKKRIGITIAILVFLHIASRIPLPGIDASILEKFFSNLLRTQGKAAAVLFPQKGLERLTIFGLGLMPFLSSCILIQICSIFIAPLRRYSFGGEKGRYLVSKYTLILTIVMAMIQSFLMSLWLGNPNNFHGFMLVSDPGIVFQVVTILTMTAAVIILLLAANLISSYGLGNGIALIVISQFPSSLIQNFYRMYVEMQTGVLPLIVIILSVAIFLLFIYGIFYVTRLTKTISIKTNNSTEIFIPFRPTLVGNEPLGWAMALFLLPATIAAISHQPAAQHFLSQLMGNRLFYWIISICLIALLTFLYALIVFDPKYIKNLLSKYGYSFSSNTADSVEESSGEDMTRVLIVTALFFIGIFLMPYLIGLLLKIPYYGTKIIFGASVVIVIGVFSDIIAQLSFFKEKYSSGIENWNICYVAFDEIEAEITKTFLEDKGITALIEPLRFSWGMPIRTMVDQYRIYVAADNKEKARSLILEENNNDAN